MKTHLGCALMVATGITTASSCSSDESPPRTPLASTPDAGGAPATDANVSSGIFTGACGDAVPAGAVEAPDPPAYTGGQCPALVTGVDVRSTLTSSGVERQFMLVVPDGMTADEDLPLVFLWHWLGGAAADFAGIVDVQNVVNQERFIAVIPEAIGGTASSPGSNPISKWRGWATPNPDTMRDEELVFFDDMLSCVSEQFPVDKNCVSSAGVSDGALWTSQLIGGRGDYLASAVVLSGGVSDGVDENSALIKVPLPFTRPLPALVLWGGPTDICIVLKFETATRELERLLDANGHFIVECQHNCGHSVPPIEVAAGQSLLMPFIDFIRSHPFWTTPGSSPYETAGLPEGMPAWCGIGAGSAVARQGACTGQLGCPVL